MFYRGSIALRCVFDRRSIDLQFWFDLFDRCPIVIHFGEKRAEWKQNRLHIPPVARPMDASLAVLRLVTRPIGHVMRVYRQIVSKIKRNKEAEASDIGFI